MGVYQVCGVSTFMIPSREQHTNTNTNMYMLIEGARVPNDECKALSPRELSSQRVLEPEDKENHPHTWEAKSHSHRNAS